MTQRTAVADAAAELARAVTVAEVLIGRPDTEGTTAAGSATVPSAPWNTQAANAALDAHQLARRLEASLRRDVTGRTGPARGGSDANTLLAIAAITSLSYALPEGHVRTENGEPCPCGYCRVARLLTRMVMAVERLPAVDTAEVWQRVAAECPYCGRGMLRYAPRSGRLTCLAYGSCADSDGNHPVGHLTISELDSMPCVAWADGLVT
jgi:hypothetical protein